VNRSEFGFVVDGSSLRFPLSGIKSLQSSLIHSLLDERAEKGPFKDLFDFAGRMKKYGLSLPSRSASSMRAPSIRSIPREPR
jgi:DNA polymerase-3 subunit alpha